MKKLMLFLLFVPLVSFGQEYYVSAREGLNVREAPDAKAKKIETLLYGQKVTVESETGIKLTINPPHGGFFYLGMMGRFWCG